MCPCELTGRQQYLIILLVSSRDPNKENNNDRTEMGGITQRLGKSLDAAKQTMSMTYPGSIYRSLEKRVHTLGAGQVCAKDDNALIRPQR